MKSMKMPNKQHALPESADRIKAVISMILDANETRFVPWAAVVRTVLRQLPGVPCDDVYPSCRSLAGVEYQDNGDAGIAIHWRLVKAEEARIDPAEREAQADDLADRREAWKRMTAKLSNSFGGSLDLLEEVIDLMAEARGAPIHISHPGLIAREVARQVGEEGRGIKSGEIGFSPR